MESPVADASVVVGVSESADSDRAVDWAAEWAARTGRTLTLVYVAGDVAVHPSTEDFLAAERAAAEAGQSVVAWRSATPRRS